MIRGVSFLVSLFQKSFRKGGGGDREGVFGLAITVEEGVRRCSVLACQCPFLSFSFNTIISIIIIIIAVYVLRGVNV